MPRGVYDRSKFKKSAKSEVLVAKSEGNKRGRKPKLTPVGAMGEATPVPAPAQLTAGKVSNEGASLYALRDCLSTLTGTRATVTNNANLIAKLDALIGKTVDLIDTTMFPVIVKVEAAEEISAPAPSAPKNGTVVAAPAPVAQAPVAFNPPAFTQPQS